MTTISRMSDTAEISEEISSTDDFDLSLLIAMIASAQTELIHLRKLNNDLLLLAKREQANRRYYQNTRKKDSPPSSSTSTSSSSSSSKFPSWSELSNGISDAFFRRKYRMTKKQFDKLCDRIQSKVGSTEFRPENGRGVGGKVRVAIALRILCGGSYLDLVGRAYGINSSVSVYNYFHTFIKWVNRTFTFPLKGLLEGLRQDDIDSIAKLKEISSDFAVDSDNCFVGCIGAIDGIAIRIRCPSDDPNPGSYYCRKNFYALNAQAICYQEYAVHRQFPSTTCRMLSLTSA